MKTLTIFVHAGLFCCFHNPQTLTWTMWSSTCICDIFACTYTWGTSVYSFIWRTFHQVCKQLTPNKSQGGHKAVHIIVTPQHFNSHPSIWWPSSIVLNFGFAMEFSVRFSCYIRPKLVICIICNKNKINRLLTVQSHPFLSQWVWWLAVEWPMVFQILFKQTQTVLI